jgi:hypothetical protein
MTEQQAAVLIAQNQVVIAMLHASILGSGNPAAIAIANAQMKIAADIQK